MKKNLFAVLMLVTSVWLLGGCATTGKNLATSERVDVALEENGATFATPKIVQKDGVLEVYGKLSPPDGGCVEQCHVDMSVSDASGSDLIAMSLPYVNRGKRLRGWSGAHYRARLPLILEEDAKVSLVFHNAPRATCEVFLKRETMKTALRLSDDLLEKAQIMLRIDDYRRFEDAENMFLALRSADPDDAAVTGWLAQLYVAWAEQLKSEAGLLGEKLETAKSAERVQDAALYRQIRREKQERMNYALESAQALGRELIGKNPEDYLGHRVIADYYRVLGDREQMMAHIAKVKSLNPQSTGLLFIEGAARAQFDRDYEAAIALYDRALAKDPMFVKALYFKGLALHALGEDARAALVFEQVLQKSPEHPGVASHNALDAYIDALKSESALAE